MALKGYIYCQADVPFWHLHMKDIPGYEGRYAVTEDGRIWTYSKVLPNGGVRHPGKWLSLSLSTKGYAKVSLGRGKYHRVHRLVASVYIPNPSNLPHINHKNGVKTDNRVENLEWVTNQENVTHAIKSGLWGSKVGFKTILTDEDVAEIRDLHSQGWSTAELVCRFGISRSWIKSIKRGYVRK